MSILEKLVKLIFQTLVFQKKYTALNTTLQSLAHQADLLNNYIVTILEFMAPEILAEKGKYNIFRADS
jgi:hypothetical protein